MRKKLRSILHKELFQLQKLSRQKFHYGLADDSLRSSFAQNGYPLGSNPRFRTKSPYKWKLSDERNAYLVKDLGDHLLVIKENFPVVSSLIELVLYDQRSKLQELRERKRRTRFQQEIVRKKRQDQPNKLLINIGAGIWYARDWKTLDHDGDWYRYISSFIDFKHDLTSDHPFPIPDGSVDLFYCEHTLEHFNDECNEHILLEAHRCLRSGGCFRIVVPDGDLIYDRLVKHDESFFKSWMDRDNTSLEESFCTLVGHARSPLDEADFHSKLSTMSKEDFLSWCKRDLKYDVRRAGEHINSFTSQKLRSMLQNAGFQEVRHCAAQQSQFSEARGPGFDTRAWYSLHVECCK